MSTAWNRFAGRVLRSESGSDYEYLGASDWPPLRVYPSNGTPRSILYFTKDYLIRRTIEPASLDLRSTVIVRYGIPSEAQCRFIRGVVESTGVFVSFIGDLDPMDLTVFCVLRAGRPDLVASLDSAVPVRYLGIDDHWLGECEKHAKRGLDFCILKMSKIEVEHLEVLTSQGFDVGSIAGKNCAMLLDSGHKLELEGACNPALYRPGFTLRLRNRVFGSKPHR